MVLELRDQETSESGPSGMRRQRERLVRLDPRNDSLCVIGDFPGEEFSSRALTGGPEIRLAPPWGRSLHVATAGDRVFVAVGNAFEIAVYDGDCRLRGIIRRAFRPVPLTPVLAARLSDRMLEDIATGAPEAIRAMLGREARRAIAELPRPASLPPYGGLVADLQGDLWVRPFDTSGDGPSDWSVFGEAGTWLGTVALPSRLEPLEVGSDYVLGRETDALGVEHIIVYALEKA